MAETIDLPPSIDAPHVHAWHIAVAEFLHKRGFIDVSFVCQTKVTKDGFHAHAVVGREFKKSIHNHGFLPTAINVTFYPDRAEAFVLTSMRSAFEVTVMIDDPQFIDKLSLAIAECEAKAWRVSSVEKTHGTTQ